MQALGLGPTHAPLRRGGAPPVGRRGSSVCRVIAPPSPRPRTATGGSTASTSTSSSGGPSSNSPLLPPAAGDSWPFWTMVSSTTAFASQLMSHFPRWALLAPTAEQVLQEASSMREKQANQQPADVSRFLAPVGVWELKAVRKLAHLTSLTYLLHLVTPRNMERMHNLELVTTSRSCAIRPYEHSRSATEVGADGDGMAVSFQTARDIYTALKEAREEAAAVAAAAAAASASTTATASNIVALPNKGVSAAFQPSGSGGDHQWPVPLSLQQQAQSQASATGAAAQPPTAASAASSATSAQQQRKATSAWRSPADVVSAKLAEAASAASAAANPLASAAESLYAGLAASLPIGSALGANNRASNALLSQPAAPIDTAQRVSSVAIAAITAAEFKQQAANERARAARGGALAPASTSTLGMSTATPACPSEWFVVDDTSTSTRLFVIQGSDTIDHWRLNLTFDPVVFETPELGIKVHRGVYEAAKELYERFLPLVYEHLESSPFAKISFTGHSVGGSLATLLMIMFKLRGVLPSHTIATVYTFGAPAVFCQSQLCAEHGPEADGPACSPGGCGCGAPASLLATLGLPEHIVRNVIMTRDIVPRAYACDYSQVADILKGWGPAFKEHSCLNRSGRKHLYYFVGRMMVLQPDRWHSFIGGDPDHPMLPPGPELYNLVDHTAQQHPAQQQQHKHHVQAQAQAAHGLGNPEPEHRHHHHPHKHNHHPRQEGHGQELQQQQQLKQQQAAWSRQGQDAHSAAQRQPHADGPDGGGAASLALQQRPQQQQAAPAAAASSSGRGRALDTTPPGPGSGGGSVALAPAAAAAATGPQRRVAGSLVEAVWEMMDTPHPLETLADPGAYLTQGIISRYHNPEHYCKALGRITFLKRKHTEKRIPAHVTRGFRYVEPGKPSESSWECSDQADVVAAPLPHHADVHRSA